MTARRRRNQGRLTKLVEMRAERKAMTGAEGVAKLATTADDGKTKVLIDAEHVFKAFGDRAILRDFRRGPRAAARRGDLALSWALSGAGGG